MPYQFRGMNMNKDIDCNLCKLRPFFTTKQPQNPEEQFWGFEPYNGNSHVFVSADLSRYIERLYSEKQKNGDTWKFTLFRYAKLSQLYNDIRHSLLKFPSPSHWPDPFEKFAYELIQPQNHGSIKGCICLRTERTHNENYAWEVYGEKEPIVRCEFDFDEFVDKLQECAMTGGNAVDFYISLMDYSLDRKEIEQILRRLKKVNCPTYLDCILRILTLKRKSFAGENEVRVFAVLRDSNPIIKDRPSRNEEGNESGLPNLSVNKPNFQNIYPFEYQDCLKRIVLPPLLPNEDSHPCFCNPKLPNYIYQLVKDAFNHGIDLYKGSKKVGKFNCQAHQSRLYDISNIKQQP